MKQVDSTSLLTQKFNLVNKIAIIVSDGGAIFIVAEIREDIILCLSI